MRKKSKYKILNLPDNLDRTIRENRDFENYLKESLLYIMLDKQIISQWRYEEILRELKKGE